MNNVVNFTLCIFDHNNKKEWAEAGELSLSPCSPNPTPTSVFYFIRMQIFDLQNGSDVSYHVIKGDSEAKVLGKAFDPQ